MKWGEPGKVEDGFRFGCGALFGLAFAVAIMMRLFPDNGRAILLGGLAVAVIFGLLSMRWFWDFWEWVKRWGFWW